MASQSGIPSGPEAGGAAAEGGRGGALASSGASGEGAANPPLIPPAERDASAPACTNCETLRILGDYASPLLGSPGGGINVEICPENQVMVGLDYEYAYGTPADYGYFGIVSVACGVLSPEGASGSVLVSTGELLPARGGGGTFFRSGRCPAGQVVTGFDGASNFDGATSEIRYVTLQCAPLSLGADAADAVNVGPSHIGPTLAVDFELSTILPSTVLPTQPCPAGQVARGALVYAGEWVDGFSLVCGAPVLARADGASCTDDSQCSSGHCSETCQARPCNMGSDCSCAVYESTQYAFCTGALAHAAAESACATGGMYLAHAAETVKHGWLRATARPRGIQAAFWLGADDLAVEGQFQWSRGGGVVDLLSRLWDYPERRGGSVENCLQMARNGLWDDADCELPLPYVCASP